MNCHMIHLFLFLFFVLATPHGMQNLSSLHYQRSLLFFVLFSSLSFVLLALHIHRKLLMFCPHEQRVFILRLSPVLKGSPHSAPRVEFTPFISPPTSSVRCCLLPGVTNGLEGEWLRLGASQSWAAEGAGYKVGPALT